MRRNNLEINIPERDEKLEPGEVRTVKKLKLKFEPNCWCNEKNRRNGIGASRGQQCSCLKFKK